MTTNVQGPGIFYVNSKIIRPDLLDEATFTDWYDNDHVPEILRTSGIESAFRFKHSGNGPADRPYLAMYPMKDIAFTLGAEFGGIGVYSEILPDGGPVYDLADFDARVYRLVEVDDHTKKGKGLVKSVIVVQSDVDELTEKEFNERRKEQLERLSHIPGYLRTTTFDLAFALSNAQLRAAKGLPTTDAPLPDPPKWLAVYEFECDKPDSHSLGQMMKPELTPRPQQLPEVAEHPIFKVIGMQGRGGWFHGMDNNSIQ